MQGLEQLLTRSWLRGCCTNGFRTIMQERLRGSPASSGRPHAATNAIATAAAATAMTSIVLVTILFIGQSFSRWLEILIRVHKSSLLIVRSAVLGHRFEIFTLASTQRCAGVPAYSRMCTAKLLMRVPL